MKFIYNRKTYIKHEYGKGVIGSYTFIFEEDYLIQEIRVFGIMVKYTVIMSNHRNRVIYHSSSV